MLEAKYEINYNESCIKLVIFAPELDVDLGDEIRLQVQDQEIVFMAPPYYSRIPTFKCLEIGELVPESINHETSKLTYKIKINTKKCDGAQEQKEHHTFNYGFDSRHSGELSIQNQQDMKTLSNPEKYSQQGRHNTRIQDETTDFSPDHYGMDYVQYIINGLDIEPYDFSTDQYLTETQKYQINQILDENRKTKLPSIKNMNKIWFGLIDILLAVMYDKATNANEINEANSHVNIHRISSTLSYFEEFESYFDVFVAFSRRSLIYPFYRNKDISRKCIQLLVKGFQHQNQKSWVLEKLVHAYNTFKSTDCVLLNHYYIKDYIKYVSWTMSDSKFSTEVVPLQETFATLDVQCIGLDLDVLEAKFIGDIFKNSENVNSDDSDDFHSCSESESESETNSSSAFDSDDYEEDSVNESHHGVLNLSSIKEEDDDDDDDVIGQINQLRI